MTSAGRPRCFWTEDALLEPAVQQALRERLGAGVRFDEPLARHTSLQVGGPADAYVRPASVAELCDVLGLCRSLGLPWRVLGRGFNTLVCDGGLRGVTLSLSLLRELALEDELLRAQAGVTHSAPARFCSERGRMGMEFAVGIPGSVGGWLRMNAGTRECDMSQVVEAVDLLTPGAERPERHAAGKLEWRYRELGLPQDAVVVGGCFRTRAGDPARIRERMDAQLEARRTTQPVTERSFGSVFKNPPGDHAGRLIEAAGLKGARAGDAEISRIHANFIVNRGRARAADVLELIERARGEVAGRFGIELEPEVHIVGEPTCG